MTAARSMATEVLEIGEFKPLFREVSSDRVLGSTGRRRCLYRLGASLRMQYGGLFAGRAKGTERRARAQSVAFKKVTTRFMEV